MFYVENEMLHTPHNFISGVVSIAPSNLSEEMAEISPKSGVSDEFLAHLLHKNKIPYYKEAVLARIIDESGNDAAYEDYKGIFIDRDTGEFKILSGRFPDKKAMIRQYGEEGKDYIVRKVFEKPVFDWIIQHAENTLDSYLMLSTAMSKWKNSEILKKYYFQIIEEMPELFPGARGNSEIDKDDTKDRNESVELQEKDATNELSDEEVELKIGNEKNYNGVIFFKDKNNNYINNPFDTEEKLTIPTYFKSVDSIKGYNQFINGQVQAVFEQFPNIEEQTQNIEIKFKSKSGHEQQKPILLSKEDIIHGKDFTKSITGYNLGDTSQGKIAFNGIHRVNKDANLECRIYPVTKDGKKISSGKSSTLVSINVDEDESLNDKQVMLKAWTIYNGVDTKEQEAVFGFVLDLNLNNEYNQTMLQNYIKKYPKLQKTLVQDGDGRVQLFMSKDKLIKNNNTYYNLRYNPNSELAQNQITPWTAWKMGNTQQRNYNK